MMKVVVKCLNRLVDVSIEFFGTVRPHETVFFDYGSPYPMPIKVPSNQDVQKRW